MSAAVASGTLLGNATRAEVIWLVVGFAAQMMFAMRFLIQWVYTERARESVVPEAFWYFSLVGGLMLLTYAVYRGDPVFILGQAMGLVVYSRNLYFIWTRKAELRSASPEK
ncbi:lipid-A-disaccharide synthase [Methyloligella halotolerans]|uniref:Lipid-A-disaccharide synthase n=1 Tax=Methyloligella halotolerans TaxID=1177755 RepID=A0A1E2RYQ0_9HYPH|nr:lipid-A-disaccharide synthase N-terminal domain-containing protein [Methyloligella halotolerans]ODA67366.1 lipid-A-disaccharide synthase [Methyloligella halotolerans]